MSQHDEYRYPDSVYPVQPNTDHILPLDDDTVAEYLTRKRIPISVLTNHHMSSRLHEFSTGEVKPSLVWVYLDENEKDPARVVSGIRVQAMGDSDYETRGYVRQMYGANRLPLDGPPGADEPLVITARELDVVALQEYGVAAMCIPCVPRIDANRMVDPRTDVGFQFLHEQKDLIDQYSRVVLAFPDGDIGDAVVHEIARRIGRAKCWTCTIPRPNYYLCDAAVKQDTTVDQLISKAEPMPLSGLYSAESFRDKFENLYNNGFAKGASTGLLHVDGLFNIYPLLYVVTGIPGSGKSEFIDQITMNTARGLGWRHAVCSFENPPHIHLTKLSEKYVGKPFFDGVVKRMSADERDDALDFINDHYVFFDQVDETPNTVAGILERARDAVMRMGVRTLTIDPYNFIERDPNASETDFVSDMLTRITRFIRAHDVAVFLVAHPQKLYPDAKGNWPVPNGYHISGSAHWMNKADVGVTVHRDKEDGTSIHNWKTRFKHTGNIGTCYVDYDVPTGIYSTRGAQKSFKNEGNDHAGELDAMAKSLPPEEMAHVLRSMGLMPPEDIAIPF